MGIAWRTSYHTTMSFLCVCVGVGEGNGSHKKWWDAGLKKALYLGQSDISLASQPFLLLHPVPLWHPSYSFN